MSCPNTNLPEWKLLVSSRGEDVAYALWDKYNGEVPESESRSEIVKAGLKATNILQSPKADQFFNAVTKNKITGDFFWKKMQADLGIPKDQIEILKSFDTEDREELIASLLANYSFAIEINIAKESENKILDLRYVPETEYGEHTVFNDFGGHTNFDSKEDALRYIKEKSNVGNTSYYSNLTVPGGTNYTENEIATPAITPSIKGHAQFATDQGIGWFRSDESTIKVDTFEGLSTYAEDQEEEDKLYRLGYYRTGKSNEDGLPLYKKKELPNPVKIRRILEVQSDLFQKGRDSDLLVNTLNRDRKDNTRILQLDNLSYDRDLTKEEEAELKKLKEPLLD